MKTRYRLAKAQLGQGEWAAAAETVDQALLALKGRETRTDAPTYSLEGNKGKLKQGKLWDKQ